MSLCGVGGMGGRPSSEANARGVVQGSSPSTCEETWKDGTTNVSKWKMNVDEDETKAKVETCEPPPPQPTLEMPGRACVGRQERSVDEKGEEKYPDKDDKKPRRGIGTGGSSSLSHGTKGSSGPPALSQSMQPTGTETQVLERARNGGVKLVKMHTRLMAFACDDACRSQVARSPKYAAQLQLAAQCVESMHGRNAMLVNLGGLLMDSSLYALFQNNCVEFRMHWDRPAGMGVPPLDIIFAACASMENWLALDPENVVVLHTRGGMDSQQAMGFLRFMAACFLTFTRDFEHPIAALKAMLDANMPSAANRAAQGNASLALSSTPSQRRYYQYLADILSLKLLPKRVATRMLRLKRVVVHPDLPLLDGTKYKDPRGALGAGHPTLVVYVRNVEKKGCSVNDRSKPLVFDVEQIVHGDISIAVWAGDKNRLLEPPLFSFAFHSVFAEPGVVRVHANQIDSTYPLELMPNFYLDVTLTETSGQEGTSGQAPTGSQGEPEAEIDMWGWNSMDFENDEINDEPIKGWRDLFVLSPPKQLNADVNGLVEEIHSVQETAHPGGLSPISLMSTLPKEEVEDSPKQFRTKDASVGPEQEEAGQARVAHARRRLDILDDAETGGSCRGSDGMTRSNESHGAASSSGVPPPPPLPPPPPPQRHTPGSIPPAPPPPPLPQGKQKSAGGLHAPSGMGGKGGAPPPPPPPPGRGKGAPDMPPLPPGKPNLKGGSNPSGNQPRLRALYWTKLHNHQIAEGTVWYELQPLPPLDGAEYDATCKLFTLQDGPKNRSGKPNASVIPAFTLQFLPPRRANNIAIMLTQFKAYKGGAVSAVRAALFEGLQLPLEKLSLLVQIFADRDEISAAASFRGNKDELTLPEYFLVQSALIPRVQQKVQALVFMGQFDSLTEDILGGLECVIAGCKKVRSSRTFRDLLSIIVTVGNTLNAASVRGNAVGVKLDVLSKLTDVKITKRPTASDVTQFMKAFGVSGSSPNTTNTKSERKDEIKEGIDRGQDVTSTIDEEKLEQGVFLALQHASNLLEFVAAIASGREVPIWNITNELSILKECSTHTQSDLEQAVSTVKEGMETAHKECKCCMGHPNDNHADHPSDDQKFATVIKEFQARARPVVLEIQNKRSQCLQDFEDLTKYLGIAEGSQPEELFGGIWNFAISLEKAHQKLNSG